ncbi:hypothetical protein CEUSTIGMA_g13625.t1, partial [Chlamydomonas eustigma]
MPTAKAVNFCNSSNENQSFAFRVTRKYEHKMLHFALNTVSTFKMEAPDEPVQLGDDDDDEDENLQSYDDAYARQYDNDHTWEHLQEDAEGNLQLVMRVASSCLLLSVTCSIFLVFHQMFAAEVMIL